jgi:hypothetical protein
LTFPQFQTDSRSPGRLGGTRHWVATHEVERPEYDVCLSPFVHLPMELLEAVAPLRRPPLSPRNPPGDGIQLPGCGANFASAPALLSEWCPHPTWFTCVSITNRMPQYSCAVSKPGISCWIAENLNCALQHRRSRLAALIPYKRLRSTMMLSGSRNMECGP